MTYFTLKVLEYMAALIALYLNRLLATMVLSVLCPPLLPLASMLVIASFVIFFQQRAPILAKAENDIQAAEQGQISMFQAGCSAMAAGFSATFFYPSTKVYQVLKNLAETTGDSISAMLSPNL